MSRTLDAIVVGLGVAGASIAAELAARGLRVLGLDRFRPPHTHGSSHGETRIIREAYFEHPDYVPLLQRAYERWSELEHLTRRTLLTRTGGLMVGPPDGVLVSGALRSAETHGLAHTLLTNGELRARHPALRPEPGMVGVAEPRAGLLLAEACVGAYLELATQRGADLHHDERVLGWRATASGVEVETAFGRHAAGHLVLAAGPWMASLLPELALPLTVERNVQFWFEPADPAPFAPDRFPVFILEHAPGAFAYGFPALAGAVKVARHGSGEAADPEHPRRAVEPAEIEAFRALLRRILPDADGRLRRTESCFYTNTPDAHFILDRHPEHALVTLVSACSGHGFKFASVLGEVVADLALTGRSRFELGLFALARFGRAGMPRTLPPEVDV
jgi:sarcosine oxidase